MLPGGSASSDRVASSPRGADAASSHQRAEERLCRPGASTYGIAHRMLPRAARERDGANQKPRWHAHQEKQSLPGVAKEDLLPKYPTAIEGPGLALATTLVLAEALSAILFIAPTPRPAVPPSVVIAVL